MYVCIFARTGNGGGSDSRMRPPSRSPAERGRTLHQDGEAARKCVGAEPAGARTQRAHAAHQIRGRGGTAPSLGLY